MSSLLQRISEIEEEIIGIRRKIHENPETAFEEFETTRLVREYLCGLGMKVHTNGDKTGVIGLLQGGKPGPVIALRADMDALKIKELSGLPFASKHVGVCHACGHDIHTAVLLGTAKILSGYQTELSGTVKFLFQSAEECLNGSRTMIENGALEDPKTDMILALHCWPEMPAGCIGVRKGAMLSASDTFRIRVIGKGGHAAHPHKGIDPIVIAAHIITQLQTVASRRIAPTEPIVVTVGHLTAGTVSNAIPDEAVMEGTVRSQSDTSRKDVKKIIEQLATGTARAMGGDAEVSYQFGVGVTYCDGDIVDGISDAVTQVLGADRLLQVPVPSMGSEDFAFYLEKVPGALFRLGTYSEQPQSRYALHNAAILFDEKAISTGIAAMVGSVFKLSGSDMNIL